jgi:hypothetical protein
VSDLIVFTPDRDSPTKPDYTKGFRPWAREFASFHGADPDVDVVAIDCSRKAPAWRARQVLEAIAARSRLTCVAFFCHGLVNRIQLGFTTAAVPGCHVDDFARAIAEKTTWGNVVTVPLYACSTGVDGDGGFADELRDGLCVEGDTYCRVCSHTTAGRADANPNVSRFDGMGSPVGGTGGGWIVAPGSKLWAKWNAALKAKNGTLRWRFPFMSVEEVHRELVG